MYGSWISSKYESKSHLASPYDFLKRVSKEAWYSSLQVWRSFFSALSILLGKGKIDKARKSLEDRLYSTARSNKSSNPYKLCLFGVNTPTSCSGSRVVQI